MTLPRICLFFQAYIVAADEQLLKLGLLFAADMDVSLEEQPEYYSFHHKLIQEHLAARFLTAKVRNDRESFSTVFPDWETDIRDSNTEVLGFMVGMGAPIMEHVCRAFAEYVTMRGGWVDLNDWDLSVVTDLQKEAVSSGTASPNSASAVALYDSEEISSLQIRQALLSHRTHLVIVKGVKGLLPLPVKTEIDETCQHHTRALLMEDCSYGVVQHVMETLQGIPITDLYISKCGKDYKGESSHDNSDSDDSDSDSDGGNVSRKLSNWVCKGTKSTNIGSSQGECCTNIANDSLTLCRQALSIYIDGSTLPLSQLVQLCQQLRGCLQFHTLHLERVNTVLPDGSVTDHLPNELLNVVCEGLCHLNKLQVTRLGGDPLGVHGEHITKATNTWQPEPQLGELHLEDCKLPSTVTGGLLQALATRCHQLEILNLASNHLSDQVAALTSHTHPLLKELQLRKCNLQPADGHALAAAIQQHRLPQLKRLDLGDNRSLGEEAAAAILTAALPHHQRELGIFLGGCNMSDKFAEEWRQKCEGTHVVLFV